MSTPDYRYTDPDGDAIAVRLIGRKLDDALGVREPAVEIQVGDVEMDRGQPGIVHVPLAEAHVLAAAILAPLLPRASEVTIDLDGYRFTQGRRS